MEEQKVIENLSPEEAFAYNQRAMIQIVRTMKEIPELPSEKKERTEDISPLIKVELPESGGVLTYMQGHEFPFQGFPYWEFVDAVDKVKKLAKAQVSGIYHYILKGGKLKLLTLLPAAWTIKRIINIEVYTFYRWVERFRLKPQMYSISIRELHRCFTEERKGEALKDREFRLMLRDVICMVLEFDNAYRFRFQDIITELDLVAIKKAPLKELKRLIKIAASRERLQEGKDMWTLVQLAVNLLLFDKRSRKIVSSSLSMIDKEKVKFIENDLHFASKRKDYKFGFMKE